MQQRGAGDPREDRLDALCQLAAGQPVEPVELCEQGSSVASAVEQRQHRLVELVGDADAVVAQRCDRLTLADLQARQRARVRAFARRHAERGRVRVRPDDPANRAVHERLAQLLARRRVGLVAEQVGDAHRGRPRVRESHERRDDPLVLGRDLRAAGDLEGHEPGPLVVGDERPGVRRDRQRCDARRDRRARGLLR